MLNILKKELKDTFRDRRTLLLTVLLPLVLMSALVFFYEKLMSPNVDEALHIVTDEATLPIATTLLATDSTVVVSAVDDVEAAVQKGDALAGFTLPANFEQAMADGMMPVAQLFGDAYSEKSWRAMTAVETALLAYSQTIVADRLAVEQVDTSILTPFTIETTQVVEGDHAAQMMSFLIPMMLIVAVGIGISSCAADFIAGEKERRTMEALLMTPVNRSAFLLGKWLTLVIVATITGIVTLAIVGIEIYFFTEELKAGMTIDGNVWAIAAIGLLLVISLAALMASALLLTSIFGKTVKEAQSYGTPITMVGILPAMVITSIGISELTTTHFAIPIMNIFAMCKELFVGIIDFQHIAVTVGVNFALAFVLLAIGRVLFMKDKWVL